MNRAMQEPGTMGRIRYAALAGLALVGFATASGAEDARPLSPAQLALFESDHMAAIGTPERLEYSFRVDGSDPAGGYTDRVLLDVRPRDDGLKDIWVDFLSGERHRAFAPVIGFRGNPALMFFLEHDVEEMRRQTGGAATYFRNRIRQALVDQAQLDAVELSRDGRTEKATAITLVPFRNDAHLAALPGFKEKVYRFVLSDAVPGTIYRIATEIPGESGAEPRLSKSMTFAREAPCGTPEGPCAAPDGK
jgi:hypothetical protein